MADAQGGIDLTATIARLEPLIEKAGQVLKAPVVEQNVTHTYQGAGGLLPAAVTACFCTLFIVLIVYLVLDHRVDREIDNLQHQHGQDTARMDAQQAWIDTLRGKVERLQGQIDGAKK